MAFTMKIDFIDYISHRIQVSISTAKRLMKRYGGIAYTHHIDRSGCCFEVTPISLEGNNSKVKYNHHL